LLERRLLKLNKQKKFVIILSILISLGFISLTLLNIEVLGPYLGLYAISYFLSYRVLTSKIKITLLGFTLLLLFLFIAALEVLNSIGFNLPKI